MTSAQKGPFLPKFGDWDEKNPAAAEGFTVIFNRARDNKKNGGGAGTPNNVIPPQNRTQKQEPAKEIKQKQKYPRKQDGVPAFGRPLFVTMKEHKTLLFVVGGFDLEY
ncbi:RPM1-interacting protein 4-like [Cucumis melo var. makuwa]|uniref:RPM1-interacting protein 4-like n=1 Tax=Cucumis melo var. makuwa TaxID=1194695 RepID=A0A5D3CUX8_CUCMM|nr:RPM1-interacting protein 4-like [Cucumis melo var. makuwa]TYK15693.1 RPM1-interacting protein 4-like [Cucumis melo var. makuwa]